MKKTILPFIALMVMARSPFALSQTAPVKKEAPKKIEKTFEEKFEQKKLDYIRSSELEVTITGSRLKDEISEEFDPIIILSLKACKPAYRQKLQIASWEEIKSYVKVFKKDADLPPLIKKVRTNTEVCRKIGKIRANASKLAGAKLRVDIGALKAQEKTSIDLTDRDAYLKVIAKKGGFPFREKIGSEGLATSRIAQKLLFDYSSMDIEINALEELDFTLRLKLRTLGSNQYNIPFHIGRTFESPLELIDAQASDSKLSHLIYGDAGVSEGYTIKEHTARVMELLKEQFHCHDDKDLDRELKAHTGVGLGYFLQMTMSMHDIGKPLAVAAGDKYRQHEFTLPILKENFRGWGLSEEAVEIASALTDNDILGDFLKGSIGASTAQRRLESKAQETGLDVQNFFKLQKAFYTADAGSYPFLYDLVFAIDEESGCLAPKADKFKSLENAILGEK